MAIVKGQNAGDTMCHYSTAAVTVAARCKQRSAGNRAAASKTSSFDLCSWQALVNGVKDMTWREERACVKYLQGKHETIRSKPGTDHLDLRIEKQEAKGRALKVQQMQRTYQY
jgi:hypothetical protein